MTKIDYTRTDEALPPSNAYGLAAGADLSAAEDFELGPGERTRVRTGIAIAIPGDCVGIIAPRSGLASRMGITVINSPGIIDPDYRGEIEIALVNLSNSIYLGRKGDRIAQLLIMPIVRPEYIEVDELPVTTRGIRGFGSSGK
ncbi:triphosphate nucleotidohydrolase [Rathayibacter phage NCPPB3778]|nr:triphosphate nucleotidohydrolase [Rathayibacter phage NCPPB3778]